jgi:uncharacterized protein
MIIKFTNLSVGIHAIQFEKSVEELQLGDPFVDKLILDCKFDKSIHQIVVTCNLTIFTKLNCDRCNDDFKRSFDSHFTLLYLFNKKEIDEDEINVKFLSLTDDKIDLTDDVIDYARLSIPMKKLCNEDCKGLCIKCGTNLNHKKCNCTNEDIDPVWDQLFKLKDKLN